jgi:hypothetical protein
MDIVLDVALSENSRTVAIAVSVIAFTRKM